MFVFKKMCLCLNVFVFAYTLHFLATYYNLYLKVISQFCALEVEWLDSLLVFCQVSWRVLVT